MHVDLRMLRALVVVEQSGSFVDAARVLRFSAPAVSAHIQALEKECGARLVSRQGPRTVLTEAGRRAVPIARLMLAAAGELEQIGTQTPVRRALAAPDATSSETG